MIDRILFLIMVSIILVGCSKAWTCPQTINEYFNSTNIPDNAICQYNQATGELINATQ